MTDHLPTYIFLPFSAANSPRSETKISFRDHSQRFLDKFRNLVEGFNWDSLRCVDINDFAVALNSKINQFYCEAFPLKTKFISYKKALNPWFNTYTKKLLDAKSKYFELWKLGLVSLKDSKIYKKKIPYQQSQDGLLLQNC